jgi:hypothetical protein
MCRVEAVPGDAGRRCRYRGGSSTKKQQDSRKGTFSGRQGMRDQIEGQKGRAAAGR